MKDASKSPLGQLVELVLIVGAALGLALAIQAWLVKPYKIPSGSMEPTLAIGQRVLVNRLSTHFGDPDVGDIIVFHPPKNYDDGCADRHEGREGGQPCGVAQKTQSDENFIKRVVAGPGDTVAIVGGHAIVNGKREKDAYIRACQIGGSCNFPRAIRVPKGEFFMMGDNRGMSDDSRNWGPVPKSWIIGGAFATYWPLDRIGLL